MWWCSGGLIEPPSGYVLGNYSPLLGQLITCVYVIEVGKRERFVQQVCSKIVSMYSLALEVGRKC